MTGAGAGAAIGCVTAWTGVGADCGSPSEGGGGVGCCGTGAAATKGAAGWMRSCVAPTASE